MYYLLLYAKRHIRYGITVVLKMREMSDLPHLEHIQTDIIKFHSYLNNLLDFK